MSPGPSLVDLAARHAEVADAVEARVLRVLRSGRYVGGPEVAEAEAAVAHLLGRQGAVGVASGTDALMLALQALGVRAGDEVVVPALTFFATAGAVCAVGAAPVVVDVLETGQIDPAAVEAALTPRTRAVVPVHLFGSRASLPELPVPVVDDAAQGLGASPPTAFGALTAVSAYPTKVWGAAGDAGFVAGDDLQLLDRVRRLGNHGLEGPHLHAPVDGVVGRNSRLDAVQAAVLLGHLPALDARLARRRALADRYDAGLPPWVRPLPRDPGGPVAQYAVLADDRAAVQQALDAAQVQHTVYYPRSLARQPALQAWRARPTPVADALCERLLALPLREDLPERAVDGVVEVLWRASR